MKIKEKGLLEQLLELSHFRLDNLVTPLILEYYSLKGVGYKHFEILGRMEAYYRRTYQHETRD